MNGLTPIDVRRLAYDVATASGIKELGGIKYEETWAKTPLLGLNHVNVAGKIINASGLLLN